MNISLTDAAQLAGIIGLLVLVFFRSAQFVSTITAAITASEGRMRDAIKASEGRMRDAIKASEDRMRDENREAHAGITRNIEDVKQDVRMLTQHALNRAGPPDA